MVPQTDFAASFYKSGVGSELDNLYYDSSMSYENNMGYCFYYDAERRKKAYYPATSAKVAKTPFIFLLMGIIGLPVHKNGLLPVTMVQWRGLNVLCLHRQKLNFLHIRVLGMQPNQCGVCVNDVVV